MDRKYFIQAVRDLYPNAVTIDTIEGAFDADGNQITLDDAAVIAKIEEYEAGEPMAKLRFRRNTLLTETDWWASSDLTMTAEQTAYRQALRDITETYTSLDDVVWPTKPE